MADGTLATVVDRPPSRDGSTSGSIATPEDALRLFDARRSWTFAAGLGALCVVTICVVLGLGGDPLGQRIHIAGLGATAAVALLYVVTHRDPARHAPWHTMGLAYVSMLANGSGFFYWGVFSAYLSVVTVAAYVVSSGASKRSAVVACAICIAMHAGLGVAQLAGLIAPHGLVIASPGFSWGAQLVALILLQLVLAGAVAGGLDARAKMQRVLDEHHLALRAIVQRDALLAEARAEVRDMRAVDEGRHTGERIGRFTLGKVLGRGAMGEVYDATDDAGAPCAVKVLAAHLLDDVEALRRFHREARVIGALTSPHIVRLIEVSEPDASLPFLALERLEGEDLGEWIKQRPVRELDEVRAIVRAVAAGLDAAHDAGVIHRDLKPANIFAARVGQGVAWKLLDFGVSKVSAGDATATLGQIVGTPSYMAPEQALGVALDRRADVYALGVVAYRLLTGTPAVMHGEVAAMIHEVVYRMPPQPSQLATISPHVEAVLAIALAKAPSDRFATAGELAAALDGGSPEIVERAASLLARTPWGQWLRRPQDRKRTAAG
jgi:serine/threonine-protein kinase